MADYNRRFAVKPDMESSLFAPAPLPKEADFYLSVEFQGTAGNGSSFGFEGKRHREPKPKPVGKPKYVPGPNHLWRRYVLKAKKG